MVSLNVLFSFDLSDYDIEYRIHATRRMFQRGIHEADIEIVLKSGDVIERYDDDFPLPSMLISGRTRLNDPLHVVAAINHCERKVVIITAYEPDFLKWSDDFSRRNV
ncbi:MAG: DUF4258 domain-containing protein [Nitrospirae bacterium]|nr:DUF4258 domain-containing protein [Nitrospirota bacterium]